MLTVVKDLLKELLYKIVRSVLILLVELVGLAIYLGLVFGGALLFLSGLMGANMCITVGYAVPLCKFVLLAVAGFVLMVGGLAIGAWTTHDI